MNDRDERSRGIEIRIVDTFTMIKPTSPFKFRGAGCCNLGQLGWNTQTPLSPPSLQDQRTRNSRKVGREDEGVSSTRPEMVALAECLEDHDDKISLLVVRLFIGTQRIR